MNGQQGKPRLKILEGSGDDLVGLQAELDRWYRETNIAKASVVSHAQYVPVEGKWYILLVVMYYEGDPGKQRVKDSKIWKPKLAMRSHGPMD